MSKPNFGFDYFRNTFNGKKYKKVKTFKSEKEAHIFADELSDKLKHGSSRFPPVVFKVHLGWKFGYRYRVCIPYDIERRIYYDV